MPEGSAKGAKKAENSLTEEGALYMIRPNSR